MLFKGGNRHHPYSNRAHGIMGETDIIQTLRKLNVKLTVKRATKKRHMELKEPIKGPLMQQRD